MIILLSLIAALLPPIVLLVYIWKWDQKPEPAGRLTLAFLLGVAIIIPIIIYEMAFSLLMFGASGEPTSMFGAVFDAFLGTALPEEAFKLLALWIVLYKNPYFDEHFDGIIYAVFISLGFAMVENVGYVVGEDEWVVTAVSRSLLAVPAHYAFGVLMGYFYSVYHFIDHSFKAAVFILFTPFMAHGIYDAIIMIVAVNPYFGVVGAFLLIFFCVRLHKFAKKKIVELVEKDLISGSTK